MRLFAAVELPEAVRIALGDYGRRAARSFPDARWVAPENIHLTVAFFGEVPLHDIENFSAVLGGVAAKHASFALSFGEIILVPPNARQATMLWLEMTSSDKYANLVDDVIGAARPFALTMPEAKPTHPHLTLARFSEFLTKDRTVRPMPLERSLDSLSIRSIGIFSSDLAAGGPIYRRLANLSLATP